MNTQPVPAPASLLSPMPSGRPAHEIKSYRPPLLDHDVLEAMRAPPDRTDQLEHDISSDDEAASPSAPGTYTGTEHDYLARASYNQ